MSKSEQDGRFSGWSRPTWPGVLRCPWLPFAVSRLRMERQGWAPATLNIVRRVLEDAGVEFIPHGVKRRVQVADKAALLRELQAISERSAGRHRGQNAMTEADLYNEDGLPA